MSNYVKSTNFASKDSLATGNPLKIVKGTEIDTEFNNIATAVSTKADLSSPTFLGTPSAPTAAAGTSNTQIATTAFVSTAMSLAYPVGSVYINASVSTNPSTLLGFGTWVAFGTGRVLVGVDPSDSLFDTLGETGGSKDAVVVSHTHTVTIDSAGEHNHTVEKDYGYNPGAGRLGNSVSGYTSNYPTSYNGNHTHNASASTTGSSGTNANIQPYITVYMWKRTA